MRRDGVLNIERAIETILLGSVLTIELTVLVCTPNPPAVMLVTLKLDEVLGTLAKMTELTTRMYEVVLVISERVPPTTIFNIELDTVQVVEMEIPL